MELDTPPASAMEVEPAPAAADEPEVEISENPLHPSDDRSLDQMDAPDLMSGTGSQMYAGDDGGGGGKPTDGAQRIGGGAGGSPKRRGAPRQRHNQPPGRAADYGRHGWAVARPAL